jgi:peptidoglycan-associated lipoprotein
MPTTRHLQDETKSQYSQSVFHPKRIESKTMKKGRIWGLAWGMAWTFAGVGLLFTASGCLATRSWVQDQLSPITSRLDNTDAKADRALTGMQNLHLEKRLVLDSSKPNFAFGSAALSDNAKREINGFFDDLQGSASSDSTSGRVIVIAGYTDSIGPEDYNYELGQKRAEKVAGYLVGKEGVDPTQVHVVSYGASKPVADNSSARGRRSNRRVEISVYQEKIVAGS